MQEAKKQLEQIAFWIIAVLMTLSTAVCQRLTGPIYLLRGTAMIDDSQLKFRLARSEETGKDYESEIKVTNPEIGGYVIYKRLKTADEWARMPLLRYLSA